MRDDRLSGLTVISMENEGATSLNSDEVVLTFAYIKSRKKLFVKLFILQL